MPTIYPQNASYKLLDYSCTEGIEYIQDFHVYNEGGNTFATFRIKNNVTIVGKEIRISAISTGYDSGHNVEGTSEKGIKAAVIPVEYVEISPVYEGVNIDKAEVTRGEELVFAININTIIPFNATRGLYSNESVSVETGNAFIILENNNGVHVKIDENAPIGSQIKIVLRIQEIYEYYFLQVVKNEVESISLSGGGDIGVGQLANITADLLSDDGEATCNDVSFIVLTSADACQIVKDPVTRTQARILYRFRCTCWN